MKSTVGSSNSVEEIWKPVVSPYNKRYEISNLGRIRSINPRPRILKPMHNLNFKNIPYLRVALYHKQKAKKFYVHHLVAWAFIGEQPKKTIVDHIDDNTLNNKFDNLRYITQRNNFLRAIHKWTDREPVQI